MKFLLNMNIPPSLGHRLETEAEHQCRHVADIGMECSTDSEILAEARRKNEVILTHDLDYGKLLVFSGDEHPSVVIFRPGNASVDILSNQLLTAWDRIEAPLTEGSLVILEEMSIRIRRLPKDGVKIPTSSFGRLIKKYRPLIKWSEIARIEMGLSKVNFYHSATMVLVDSTRHECPYKVLMFAARHPHFKQEGYDYVNTRAGNSVERLYRYRPYGIMKLFGIVAFIFLLGFGIGYV